jgi:hypothetical protein
MARKSLTFSEQLREKYTLPTASGLYRCIFHQHATIRPLSPKHGKKLSALVTITSRSGIFGPDAWTLGDYAAEKVLPGPANWGWRRYPGADHWLVTRNGSELFRTQNYSFLIRFFARKAGLI